MTDNTVSGRLHGRALAQEKRRQQAMRKQGGAPGSTAVPSAPKSGSVPMTAESSWSAPVSVNPDNMTVRSSGREAALAHRAMRCSGAQCWADPAQRAPRRRRRSTEQAAPQKENTSTVESSPALIPGVEEEFLDSVCDLVEKSPAEFGWRERSVRQLCRARRQTMAQRGKAALTVVRGLSSAAARLRYLENGSVREYAKLRREELAQHGRGTQATPAQPTGKQRSRKFRKVEEGTTLAGTAVTGTQVDRQVTVTGNESGTCRTVTGTEYVGAEQFGQFCGNVPAAGAPKVRITSTSGRQAVSGTLLGRSPAVTGDEAGSCRSVTGTEYLSSESFQGFCGTDLPARTPKVMLGATERLGMPVSGSDEFRPNRVTGVETGVQRAITGSQYADAGVAKMTINGAPKKVAESQTLSGRSVSGTAVDSSQRITGLEAGECRQLTGTEYMSLESYRGLCNSVPAPSPAKVGITQTAKGERVTGNLVDRSEKVTGNEPGSCQRVTGTGYSSANLCGGGIDKVQEMTSLGGSAITGTGMDRLPKMSGDERGGCWPVTGTEYHGLEQYAHCASTPQPEAPKVALSRTPRGQMVSGPAMEPSELVTGNEAGEDLPVSGTPYLGEEQTLSTELVPTTSVSVERKQGSCQCDSCAYKLAAQQSQMAAVSSRFAVEPVQSPSTFSITPPARQGRSLITGNSFDQGSRVTGPVNLARGLITGTPEFRSREPEPIPLAPMPATEAPAPSAQSEDIRPVRGAWQVTGDDWSRSNRVTGTEGPWAKSRNPTQRGSIRNCVMNAAMNKDQPLAAPVADSKITGSSGSSPRGAAVTYSGGARG
ncbi:MAG: CsoS2 family carboxysome shell protein [Acidithiobacillus sp.]|nr:CsoS2 family carboxysome shell protein [Acidithiobacillus sp.]